MDDKKLGLYAMVKITVYYSNNIPWLKLTPTINFN